MNLATAALVRRRGDPRILADLDRATFDALGATHVALRLRRRLRHAGLRRVPREPNADARADPAGLTRRQAQVLEQLRDGATNAEIAARLVIAEKTVDHHVSAVLAKLGVRSRREAVRARDAGTRR